MSPTAASAWLALSAITVVVLLTRPAPYGRHRAAGWGPTLPARWGWLLMEIPAATVIAVLALPSLLAAGTTRGWLLLALWELHYLHRAFVFPFRLRAGAAIPAAVVMLGIAFNVVNGFFNAPSLAAPPSSAIDTHVLVGAVLFLTGLAINWDADARLLRLRREAGGYAIPTGAMFRWVSCPNYLGEIIEWIGFAVAAGSLAAIGFAVWTFANLAPRARAHHRWYKERFPYYPTERRALIPWIW